MSLGVNLAFTLEIYEWKARSYKKSRIIMLYTVLQIILHRKGDTKAYTALINLVNKGLEKPFKADTRIRPHYVSDMVMRLFTIN